MPKTLIFTKLDADADRILDELGDRTGLPCRDGGDRRIFDFEGAPGDIDALAELERIDPRGARPARRETRPPGYPVRRPAPPSCRPARGAARGAHAGSVR